MQEPRYISHLKQLDFNNPDSWIFQSNEEHQHGVAMHIPVDTRSAFPVISVQSPVSIQYRWQS